MVSSNGSLPAESFFDNVSAGKPNVTVIRAATVAEVIAVLTGEPAVGPDVGSEMAIPAEYQDTMRSIASQLCDRGDQLLEQVSRSTSGNDSLLNLSRDFLRSASLAGQDGFYYSQASFCFSANLRLRELQLSGFSESRVQNLAAEVDAAIKAAQENLSARRITTFTGLQTKAIVDERLREAALYLDAGKSSGNHSSRDVAYAMERYRSAVIWSVFFDRGSDAVELDQMHLQEACETKIAEVEERRSYLSVLTDDAFALERAPLEEAYASRDEGDFALCLARAAKAKAEADVVISSIALDEESLDGMTRVKLDVARDIIQREAAQGRFPVMGYSYAEYAASLIEDDPFTAALFSSYALELSDLSIYFPRPKDLSGQVASVLLQPFMLGVFVGVLGMMLYLFAVHPSRKGPSHPRRR
jgi:predicted S18 family serine protease